MQKCQTLTGLYLPVFLSKPQLVRDGLRFLVEAAAKGTLRHSIARVLPLSKAAEAHRQLEDREVQGTVLLDTPVA
jgi:NADPH:quinone reductase